MNTYICERCGEEYEAVVDHDLCVPCEEGENDIDETSTYAKHHGPDFRDLRDEVLERDNRTCQVCGMSNEEHLESDDLFGGGLHVHHIEPVRSFEEPEEAHELQNLISLCSPCHKKVERGELEPPNP